MRTSLDDLRKLHHINGVGDHNDSFYLKSINFKALLQGAFVAIVFFSKSIEFSPFPGEEMFKVLV
jgi:hypothetical protein